MKSVKAQDEWLDVLSQKDRAMIIMTINVKKRGMTRQKKKKKKKRKPQQMDDK